MTAGSHTQHPTLKTSVASYSRPGLQHRIARRAAFTIVEVIVVIGIIVVIAGILLAAMSGVKESQDMVLSMNNLKQVGAWMRMYTDANNDYVVPSQFDYSGNPTYAGKARTGDLGYTVAGSWEENQGTWTDILWVESGLSVPALEDGTVPYRYDSPDYGYLVDHPDYRSPFWSSADNTFNAPNGVAGDLPLPFGPGGTHVGNPGFFAANNFFDSTDASIGHLTLGQIRAPERSIYLVDSAAGEVIDDDPDPWNIIPDGADDLREIDFRYNEVCLMLLLDGSYRSQGLAWEKLDDFEEDSGLRVRNLTTR